MKPYERAVAERLQAEAAVVALPPRERWVPPERRSRSRVPLVAAATVVLALVVAGSAVQSDDAPAARALTALRALVRPSPGPDGIEASMVVDGYRFVITILNDAAYGPDAARAYLFGAVAGVGHRCEWRREGPTVSAATQVTGAADAVVSTGARWAPLQTGTSSLREGGIPAAAVTATTVTVICGLRDDSGDHGVAASFQLRKAGSVYIGERLSLAAWRG